jgi:Icc-related predicted phosphoesterase
MKVTLISDTHTKHHQVTKDLPGGDLLIHAGDIMNSGYHESDVYEFLDWFENQLDKYSSVMFIAGNHDRCFESHSQKIKEILAKYPGVTYLQDTPMLYVNEEATQDCKIYGSPWQPEFFNWAFNLPRNGEEMKARWDAIPDDTDILVTHGPPHGYLDVPGGQSIRVGCEMLRYRVDEIKPKIHVFGHIHGSYGHYYNGHTHFFNASVLDERYTYTNKPFTFDWNPVTNEIIWL